MFLLPRAAGTNGSKLIVATERERVEYIGGPLDGTDGELDVLPDVLPAERGRYVRSVRCADDGAMRYVWRDDMPEVDATLAKGEPPWPTGS